ncbi:MAG: hypothetical protein ACE5IT_02910 [bacterium]
MNPVRNFGDSSNMERKNKNRESVISNRVKALISSLVIFLIWPSLLIAEVSLHGFLQGNYTPRVTGEKLKTEGESDFLLAEERVQLKLSDYSSSGDAGYFVKVDFFRDSIENNTDIDIREAYLDYSSQLYSFRIGRQIITWGVGDLLFINDVFPKDYFAFFTGRPLEYLKIGSDAFKIDFFPGFLSAEVVVIPFFEPNNLPTGQRLFIFDPFSEIQDRETLKPSPEFENMELALRFYRNVLGFDTSLYAYKGFSHFPGMRPDNLTSPSKISFFFPELAVYGFSAQGNAVNGLLSIEGGYYDSLDDQDGTDPLIVNSQTMFLVGYQRPLLWKEFNIGLQYYGEYMHKYDNYEKSLPQSFPKQDKLRQYITFRLTQFLKYQTLKLSLFAFYSPNDEDYFIIPEIKYNISDEMWISIGGNVFGGKVDNTFFGQLNKNDNLYLTLRYEF